MSRRFNLATGMLSQRLGIHCIALLGLAARLIVAFISESIHHPDEIFQYLEQSHRLVFGYGYIPWEYRFGTRSWILPAFISAILFLCKSLGLDDPAFYIPAVKVVFCFISISLVYSLYVLVRQLSGEAAANLAAVFVAFWYEAVYFAHKPTPEVLASYMLIAALAGSVLAGVRGAALTGLLSAGALALRVQYLPAVAVLAYFAWLSWNRRESAVAALLFAMTLMGAGYFDHLMWGTFGVSYLNNFWFNTVYGVSQLFGTARPTYYLESAIVVSAGLFGLASLWSLLKLEKTWLPLTLIAGILAVHSVIPHKEYRFVFVTMPLFLACLAIVTTEAGFRAARAMSCASIVIVCGLSLAGLYNQLPAQSRVIRTTAGTPLLSRDDMLLAYLFLSKEADLAAVLNTSRAWWATGGYYYLHRDVPVYWRKLFPRAQDVRPFVSHIICSIKEPEIPGFTPIHTIGALQIRRQTDPPARYARLNIDLKNLQQRGVDDKYTPTVKRRI